MAVSVDIDKPTLVTLLRIARGVLEGEHDIEDGGAPGEHPYQKPNWAMRATSALDEAIQEIVRHG